MEQNRKEHESAPSALVTRFLILTVGLIAAAVAALILWRSDQPNLLLAAGLLVWMFGLSVYSSWGTFFFADSLISDGDSGPVSLIFALVLICAFAVVIPPIAWAVAGVQLAIKRFGARTGAIDQ